MAKIQILITLLLYILLKVFGQSPCPQYFSYVTNLELNEVMGQIQIPSPPRDVQLHIRVSLSIAIALPTTYVGRLALAQSKEDSVRAVRSGRSLIYYVHFPVTRPFPLLTGIWFNNQLYCTGPRAKGQIVTAIVLEHTLYPPNTLRLSPNNGIPNSLPSQDSGMDSFSGFSLPQTPSFGPYFTIPTYPTEPTRPFTTQSPTTQSTTTQPTTTQRLTTQPPNNNVGLSDGVNGNVSQSSIQDICGLTTHVHSIINLLISKGLKTSPGQWPWLAGIFIVRIEFEFQCAGSLLTNKHVLTAAHCLKLSHETNDTVPAGTLMVTLGRYRLRDWREPGSVNREVESYAIHPDYIHQISADADLAILTLRNPVEFSPTIRPVCLWPYLSNLEFVVNQTGYVAGWGRDEFGNPYVEEPRMVGTPIVSQTDCLWSHQNFVRFTSNRTLCAGARDGNGPCNGDSGSGLILYDTFTGRYRLRGIVSRSLLDTSTYTCDLMQYVVYVDAAKFKDWIEQQISLT